MVAGDAGCGPWGWRESAGGCGDRQRVGAPVALLRDPEWVPVPVGSSHPVRGGVWAGIESFWHRGAVCRWPGLMAVNFGAALKCQGCSSLGYLEIEN